MKSWPSVRQGLYAGISMRARSWWGVCIEGRGGIRACCGDCRKLSMLKSAEGGT